MNGLISGNSIAKSFVSARLSPWMKQFAWALAFLCAVAAHPALAVDLKIGVVDYGRLAEESPQAKVALDAIRTEFTPRQRDLQTLQATLKAKEEKLQKDAATMTDDAKQRADKDLRDSYRELQRKQSEVQDDFNARRNEEMSRLQRTLIEQVRIYAKAQNFDLIIADGVIYANQSIDITPQILTALKSSPVAAAPAAAPGKPAGVAPAPTKPPGK